MGTVPVQGLGEKGPARRCQRRTTSGSHRHGRFTVVRRLSRQRNAALLRL